MNLEGAALIGKGAIAEPRMTVAKKASKDEETKGDSKKI